MVGWHHRLNGHEFACTLGDGDGQGGLACCSPRCRKELDMTKRLSWAIVQTWSWYLLAYHPLVSSVSSGSCLTRLQTHLSAMHSLFLWHWLPAPNIILVGRRLSLRKWMPGAVRKEFHLRTLEQRCIQGLPCCSKGRMAFLKTSSPGDVWYPFCKPTGALPSPPKPWGGHLRDGP